MIGWSLLCRGTESRESRGEDDVEMKTDGCDCLDHTTRFLCMH